MKSLATTLLLLVLILSTVMIVDSKRRRKRKHHEHLPFQVRGPQSLDDRIAIVGAGPAGIHMAHLLKKKGFKYIEILEKEKYMGGKSWTVNYRGAPHEMGTVYLSKDYEENIIKLVNEYVPDDVVNLPQSSVWLDGQNPVTYQEYLVRYSMAYYNTKNQSEAVLGMVRGVLKYIEIHLKIFGEYEGEIMPRPTRQVLREIRGTFKEFLERNNLEILAPLFYASHTMQGYGHIDEVAALYGLIWNTPKLMRALLGRISGNPDPGLYLLKNGFQNLWRKIVEKDQVKIIYRVDIERFWRDRDRSVSWFRLRINGGKFQYRKYDYVIWSGNMKDGMKVWRNNYRQERYFFNQLSHWYFSTALMNSEHEQRAPTAIDYWFDNMNKKREHSVWAQRDSYAALRDYNGSAYQNGSLPTGNDGLSMRTTVAYLMGRYPPTSKTQLEQTLMTHFKAIGGTNLAIKYLKVWKYFPRYPLKAIERGILWYIIEMQGRYGMWYIGSSVSFESVKSVVEYNKMMIDNMECTRT